MIPDLSTRVYNHSFRIDPIVRTLLDTDFYKLLMLQMIWRLKPETRVTFGLKNRSPAIRLADTIAESELVAQLDHARGLRFQKNELIWLAGNSFYGKARIFEFQFPRLSRRIPAAALRAQPPRRRVRVALSGSMA